MAIAEMLTGVGAGLLLGLLLDLAVTPTQRVVGGAGVAALLGSGTWLLLEQARGDVAVGVVAGVLLALGAGLVSGLVCGLVHGPTDGGSPSGRPAGNGPGGHGPEGNASEGNASEGS